MRKSERTEPATGHGCMSIPTFRMTAIERKYILPTVNAYCEALFLSDERRAMHLATAIIESRLESVSSDGAAWRKYEKQLFSLMGRMENDFTDYSLMAYLVEEFEATA